MKFNEAPTTQNFPDKRWVSEEGVWEIGLYPIVGGERLRLGKVGNGWLTIDYHTDEDDPAGALLLLSLVTEILKYFPESSTEKEIDEVFPSYRLQKEDPKKFMEELTNLASDMIKRNGGSL
jgi:hypothetical protein